MRWLTSVVREEKGTPCSRSPLLTCSNAASKHASWNLPTQTAAGVSLKCSINFWNCSCSGLYCKEKSSDYLWQNITYFKTVYTREGILSITISMEVLHYQVKKYVLSTYPYSSSLLVWPNRNRDIYMKFAHLRKIQEELNLEKERDQYIMNKINLGHSDLITCLMKILLQTDGKNKEIPDEFWGQVRICTRIMSNLDQAKSCHDQGFNILFLLGLEA